MESIRKFFANVFPMSPSRKLRKKTIYSDNFEGFSRIPLFKNIPKNKLISLYNETTEVKLAEGEYLFHEHDAANDFFILREGSLAVIKSSKNREYLLAVIGEGQTIGELGLIDHAPRSAAIKSIIPSKLLRIKFETVHELSKKDRVFDQIYKYISIHITKRLRETNVVTIKALESQVEEYKLRVIMGLFIIYVISGLCLFTFSLAGLEYLKQHISNTSFITLPLSLVFFSLFCIVIKATRLPLSMFGFNLKDARKAIIESIFYTLLFCVLILLLKWLEILLLPSFADRKLIEPFAQIHGTSGMSPGLVWVASLLVYCFFITPMQEIVARGGLQSSLDMFLVGPNKLLISIFVSNLIFSMAHLFLSFKAAILVFFPGLFLGWLYSRHKTLIGVLISHMMLGFWAFWIVGIF